MALGIPVIGGIIEKILGIGEKAADRLIPDKNKKQDQDHEGRKDQAGATLEGERNRHWTPRKILMMVLIVPVALQFGVKPSIEWIAAIIGHPVTLPGLDIAPALRILLGLLGMELGA